jgi:RimJ/RimL family protein N-acetyltransferase
VTHFIDPVVLKGTHVYLEPLEIAHEAALIEASKDGELWRLWYTSVPKPEKMRTYIENALKLREQSHEMPFVVRKIHDGKPGDIIGSTRMCKVDPASRRLEIAYTWYARHVQRTPLNTECKLLLLRHAFEQLKCIAVEFRTHWMNHKSRAAIARLGAKQDGVLRNHIIMPDGTYRDTVVFSIIESEWPTVNKHLLHLLEYT